MKDIPEIRSAMTPFPYAVDISESIGRAYVLMSEHEIRHLPVLDGQTILGVITDRDIQRATDPRSGLAPEAELRVGDVELQETYIVDIHERLDRVLETMAHRHVGSTVVVKGGRLAGIFTTTDACRCFAAYLKKRAPASGDDAA